MCQMTLTFCSWSTDLFNLHQVSAIRLISPLVYNLGLSHLVHTLIMEGTHSPGLCHITLTFFCSSSGMIYWWLSYTTWVNHIWSTHWSWKYMWASQVLPDLDLIFSLLHLLTLLCQFFVIQSVSPLQYNLGSLYSVHTVINEGTCTCFFYYTPTRREGAILQSPCPSVSPSVCLSVHSHFRNRYLGFYWKKWLHIYFLFTMRFTNERVGVFLAQRSIQHLVYIYFLYASFAC